ncbi:spore coat protein [Peribacillus frigoritolerans]|uniref:capsular polysaccharide export protein, LipB/KpsS family n=1 Tax=Peribacillus frigoritolerans TaxID=450367 RepID=UPI0024C206E8|nr:spore coat protein [Peribacillus frigoritolerans]WHX59780.1 spore coat protein [Peribacillus frigoritolerans]
MSTYLSNYWTLYQEFVETFNHLKFREIPIALLSNFYQQIDNELKIKMENKDFQTNLKSPKLNQEMIQPYFEKWLEKIRVPLMQKSINGKILINSDYTRIPELTYKKWFNPNKTIILSRSKIPLFYGIPNESIAKYELTNNKDSEEIVKNATSLFEKFKNHPAFGNKFFQQTFLNRIPLIVKTLSTVFNLFDKLDISSIVVGTTEDMQSRALCIVGSMRGIKSICLQHGILMGEEAFMPVFSTVIGVYGDYEKRWYSKRGLTINRISELGHPKFDEIFTNSRTDKETFFKRYELAPNKQTLLVITGPHLDFIKLETLIKNILDNPNFQIIIKPHPWEIGKKKYGVYLELEKKYKLIKVYNSRENNLYELISHVDGVVSSLSTVALESLLLNKPVFIYNFLNSNRTFDYFDKLGDYIQTDPNQLTKVVNNYYISSVHKGIYKNIRNQYLSDSYNDGFSGKKLIDLINQSNM